MTKRLIGVSIVLLAILGVAGVAVAGDREEREEKREAVRECVQSKEGDRREAFKACAEEHGVERDGHRLGRRALRHAAHGELIVPKRGEEGQWETIILDRGEVTAIDETSMTLKRPDGPTVTIGLTPETRFPDERPSVGERVRVVSFGGSARLVATLRD